jgi:hypothetical protein
MEKLVPVLPGWAQKDSTRPLSRCGVPANVPALQRPAIPAARHCHAVDTGQSAGANNLDDKRIGSLPCAVSAAATGGPRGASRIGTPVLFNAARYGYRLLDVHSKRTYGFALRSAVQPILQKRVQ